MKPTTYRKPNNDNGATRDIILIGLAAAAGLYVWTCIKFAVSTTVGVLMLPGVCIPLAAGLTVRAGYLVHQSASRSVPYVPPKPVRQLGFKLNYDDSNRIAALR